MPTLARRTELKILYDNKDISADLAPFLNSFTYNDVMSGAADDISLALDDRADLWKGDWLPEKGALLNVSLLAKNWREQSEQELPLGLFEIDEIELAGKPETVNIKGVSVPDNTALRGVDKTRAWEKTKLSVIAKDLAEGAGMELYYNTEEDPELDRSEQTDQSDLSFLLGLCNNAGLALKVTGSQVVIFDEAKFEQGETIGKITRNDEFLLAYTFKTSTRGIYAACRVKYQNSKAKQLIDYTFSLPDKVGKTLQINKKVSTTGEAEKLAKKELRNKNKDEVTATLNFAGGYFYAAGTVYELEGFQKFDGRYIITKASHTIGSGYTTSLELRRCLDGY